uniref:Glycine cleavage system H protein n=1 Tax=Arion vulgaris TaxID=1028688 RepID=A0A0B6ZRS8_9EUPU
MAASISIKFVRTTFKLAKTARLAINTTVHTRQYSISRVLAARLYTDKHEWVSVDNSVGTVGISHYAQEQLGEIVYVETPEVGTKLQAYDVAGCLESVKAASEIFSPIGGTVKEVNKKLSEIPSLVNSSPLDDGWLYKLNLDPNTKTDNLMTEEAYEKYVGSLDTH